MKDELVESEEEKYDEYQMEQDYIDFEIKEAERMEKNWSEFQQSVVDILNSIQPDAPFIGYAKTYALNITVNIEEAQQMFNDEPKAAVRQQMNYVLSNLLGVKEEHLDAINVLCNEYELNMSAAVVEIMENNRLHLNMD